MPGARKHLGLFHFQRRRKAIWRIVGVDRITKKVVEVATADNPMEKEMILRQEARNYDDLRAVSLRMPAGERRERAWV
jgi:hypothetical protein